LFNNPVVRNIPNYKRYLTTHLKRITYLDDRPVKEEDKRKARAWYEGGIELERKVNQEIQHEKVFA